MGSIVDPRHNTKFVSHSGLPDWIVRHNNPLGPLGKRPPGLLGMQPIQGLGERNVLLLRKAERSGERGSGAEGAQPKERPGIDASGAAVAQT